MSNVFRFFAAPALILLGAGAVVSGALLFSSSSSAEDENALNAEPAQTTQTAQTGTFLDPLTQLIGEVLSTLPKTTPEIDKSLQTATQLPGAVPGPTSQTTIPPVTSNAPASTETLQP